MRDSQLDPDDDLGAEPPDPGRRLRTTRPGVLVGAALTGLVLGRLIRPLALGLDQVPPRVSWLPVVALGLAAAIMAGAAWLTRRARRRDRVLLSSSQAVNRLVLAKACSLVGALVAGGYAGYAVSWVGSHAELGAERILRSALAAVAAAGLVFFSLALEQACRVDDTED